MINSLVHLRKIVGHLSIAILDAVLSYLDSLLVCPIVKSINCKLCLLCLCKNVIVRIVLAGFCSGFSLYIYHLDVCFLNCIRWTSRLARQHYAPKTLEKWRAVSIFQCWTNVLSLRKPQADYSFRCYVCLSCTDSAEQKQYSLQQACSKLERNEPLLRYFNATYSNLQIVSWMHCHSQIE